MSELDSCLLVSVGIPFYNAEKYLAFAILSVQAQTHIHWELILIDDGSIDNSLNIARKYEKIDSRIRVISDGLNKKLPFRLNQLISESRGSYIARMDADDIMHPERLEKQLNFLEKNNNYDLVSTGLVSINDNNKVKGYRKVGFLYDNFSSVKTSYPIVHPSVMAHRFWFERNRYSEKYSRAEDFELWTRAISHNDFKMAILPELLLYYREEGNLDMNKLINSYNDVLEIYQNYSLGSNSSFNILKTKFKILVVRALFYSGNLQKLATRRNRFFKSDDEKIRFQKHLDSIVISDSETIHNL